MPPQSNVTSAALRTLHRIHRQLSDLKERLGRGPNVIRVHEANVKREEDQLAKMQHDLKALRIAADNKQLQLKASEEKCDRLQRQLNEAASNREYQTLKDQIAATEMVNSVLADEILEKLEKIDELAEELTRTEAAVADVRQRAEKARQDVQQQKPLIQADIQRLEGEVRQCESTLPGDFRQAYNRVLRARGEDAMAPVEGEYCGGCNQHVPLHLVNEAMLSRPIFCKACGRLLYVPEKR